MKKLKKFLAVAIAATMATTGLTGVVNAETDYVWLEAEEGDITGYKTLEMGSTSGGKGLLLEKMNGVAEGMVEREFEIPETGKYDIKILTSAVLKRPPALLTPADTASFSKGKFPFTIY